MKGFIAINVLILLAIGFLWAAIRGFKKTSAWTMDVRLPNSRHSREVDFIDKKEKIGFRLKYLERLEKKYLQETGISGRFPFVQLPTIFLLSGLSGLVLSKWVWSLFQIES